MEFGTESTQDGMIKPWSNEYAGFFLGGGVGGGG